MPVPWRDVCVAPTARRHLIMDASTAEARTYHPGYRRRECFQMVAQVARGPIDESVPCSFRRFHVSRTFRIGQNRGTSRTMHIDGSWNPPFQAVQISNLSRRDHRRSIREGVLGTPLDESDGFGRGRPSQMLSFVVLLQAFLG